MISYEVVQQRMEENGIMRQSIVDDEDWLGRQHMIYDGNGIGQHNRKCNGGDIG